MSACATTRRGFLRTAASALGAGLFSCTFETREVADPSAGTVRSGAVPGVGPGIAERPVIMTFGDAVRIARPPSERPAAYVSLATREVYVDRAFRDRASWLLDAHISVSTWVWRIPLPGDSPLTPISPGDERREFEELPIGSWDPARSPAEGDIRIVVGRPTSVTLEFDCVPVQTTSSRISADRLTVDTLVPGPGEALREDFGTLGFGTRHADPECSSPSSNPNTVEIFGWAHHP